MYPSFAYYCFSHWILQLRELVVDAAEEEYLYGTKVSQNILSCLGLPAYDCPTRCPTSIALTLRLSFMDPSSYYSSKSGHASNTKESMAKLAIVTWVQIVNILG
jgi:hypothetical protein